MILVTVQQYFLVLLFLVITWTIFCRYVLDLVDIYYEYYSIFLSYILILKEWSIFLIPVSVSKADYRERSK